MYCGSAALLSEPGAVATGFFFLFRNEDPALPLDLRKSYAFPV
jgi:hypothetical protein